MLRSYQINMTLCVARSASILILSFSLVACNQSTFQAGTKDPEIKEAAIGDSPASASEGQDSGDLNNSEVVDVNVRKADISPTSVVATSIAAENLVEIDLGSSKGSGYEVKSLAPNEANHIWLATRNGRAQYNRIENGQIVSRRVWTDLLAPGAGGTRTYVLEGGGVLLAKQRGHLYFLYPEAPAGSVDHDPAKGYYHQLQGLGNNDRVCAVSYRRDGKRYIGIGYGAGMFVEIEQSNTYPYAPNFSQVGAPKKIHNSNWGYSCFIDQARLIYYAQDLNARGGTLAVNLRTMETVAANTVAPNSQFKSSNLPNLTVGVSAESGKNDGSYAMAGDRLGNVLNATGHYTLAYEPKDSMVWASHGANLSIYPSSCLNSQANCVGFATYALPEVIGAQVGPLSALGDGNMVGAVRGAGDIYLFRLKDPSDPRVGIESVKIIDDLGGDPYMYTDFTGATLYLSQSLNEFDFTKLGTWNNKLPLQQLGFIWAATEGSPKAWKDIKAEIRCYQDPNNKGEFSEVNIQANEKVLQFINVESCVNKKVTHAELRLVQLGNQSSLMTVEKVQLIGFQ